MVVLVVTVAAAVELCCPCWPFFSVVVDVALVAFVVQVVVAVSLAVCETAFHLLCMQQLDRTKRGGGGIAFL